MIIPIRCFTCGNILADKELMYQALVTNGKKTATGVDADAGVPFMYNIEAMKGKSMKELKSVEGTALDKLGVVKMCCRRHMLTSVDCLEDI
jgi:DNA-directed RNA polymerase subunit N (RpoN/RPB10)